jgi:hybrid cluster-associated redox disulfide protein
LRQRKDKYGEIGYSISKMEPQSISQSLTVFEILQKYPETSRVFIEEKTACIGCYMARFCSLRDVAQVYGLETETLVHEMRQAAIHKTNQNSKE